MLGYMPASWVSLDALIRVFLLETLCSATLAVRWKASDYVDRFEREMCRERLYRMDWKAVLGPCINSTDFGRKTIWTPYRTDATRSFIYSRKIKPAGQYSIIGIQSIDKKGRFKTYGGDTWRAFLRGPSSMQPLVHDLGNGKYEIPFLLFEPGRYRLEIHLEGTLCSSLKDPPKDWFKKGNYNGHFQEDWMYKKKSAWPSMLRERLWLPLGGKANKIYIHIAEPDSEIMADNLQKLQYWHDICGLQKTCQFLWDGYGRWVKGRWLPFRKENLDKKAENSLTKETIKTKYLWIYGDCYAYHFFETIWNTTFCHKIFKNCSHSYNWIYPRLHPIHELDPSIHRKDSRDISIDRIIKYLHNVTSRKEMASNSVLLLNFGLHFARATSFQNYQRLIKKVVKELYEHYQGKPIWRTTTAVWQTDKKVHKRFQTYQRMLLFNAFAMDSMCKAGIPIVDVFPMTASAPKQPEDGIHYNVSLMKPIKKILVAYGLKN